MKKINTPYFSLVILSLLLVSCNQENTERNKEANTDGAEESLEKVNRYLVKSEKQDIENYIRRHGWEMEETGSGLYYQIFHEGKGKKAEEGDLAVLDYKTWLINGNLVYTSKTDGRKEFLIGKGGVESGLEEGILLLKEGDKARFILPSHLAYGLLGDGNKIPQRTAIIYELELIKLK